MMKIGLANTTITPNNPVFLAGFAGRTDPSEGAYNDLEASVIVLDNGKQRVGIMTLDLIGADEFLVEPIRRKAAALNIPAENMLINCSHTHCGPECRVIRGSCRNLDNLYLELLKEKLFGLLEQAASGLQAGSLDYTTGFCTLAINKRRTGQTRKPPLPNSSQPIDMDVPVLRVLSPEGTVRAVLFSYAAHPTVMGGQLIGTDFPGLARDMLRDKIPGCLPVFMQGCAGDLKPRNLTAEGSFAKGSIEIVKEFGHELARAVLAALCNGPEQLDNKLGSSSIQAELPTKGTPTEQQLQELEKGNKWQQAYAVATRRTIAEKGGLAETLPVEVQVLQIGDLYLVGMGGEICCEIGMQIKSELAGHKIWTLGYSNLLRCYVASLSAHSEGSNYFVDGSFVYALEPEPKPLGLKPESAQVLAEKAVESVRSLIS